MALFFRTPMRILNGMTSCVPRVSFLPRSRRLQRKHWQRWLSKPSRRNRVVVGFIVASAACILFNCFEYREVITQKARKFQHCKNNCCIISLYIFYNICLLRNSIIIYYTLLLQIYYLCSGAWNKWVRPDTMTLKSCKILLPTKPQSLTFFPFSCIYALNIIFICHVCLWYAIVWLFIILGKVNSIFLCLDRCQTRHSVSGRAGWGGGWWGRSHYTRVQEKTTRGDEEGSSIGQVWWGEVAGKVV